MVVVFPPEVVEVGVVRLGAVDEVEEEAGQTLS